MLERRMRLRILGVAAVVLVDQLDAGGVERLLLE